jgi:ribosomal protein S18 acetylase RimI-like enzyme
MIIKTLHGIDINWLVKSFNKAFADCFIPIQMTEQLLFDKIKAENIMLNYSVGVFLEDDLVGFILTGRNEQGQACVAYNGGTGVWPEYRGNYLTEKMYQILIPLLSACGIQQHQLEVMIQNDAAIKIYTKVGFNKTRKLLCLRGQIPGSFLGTDVEIKQITFGKNLLIHNSWQPNPSWQNNNCNVFRGAGMSLCFGAFVNNRLVGYIVFLPKKLRIQQCSISKDYNTQNIANALFNSVNTQIGDKEINIINVDESDIQFVTFLKSIGFHVYAEQYEMVLEVNNNMLQ